MRRINQPELLIVSFARMKVKELLGAVARKTKTKVRTRYSNGRTISPYQLQGKGCHTGDR